MQHTTKCKEGDVIRPLVLLVVIDSILELVHAGILSAWAPSRVEELFKTPHTPRASPSAAAGRTFAQVSLTISSPVGGRFSTHGHGEDRNFRERDQCGTNG